MFKWLAKRMTFCEALTFKITKKKEKKE